MTNAQPLATPEKRELKLGYVPLIDCAPLVVAKELGFFEEQGLDVTLQAEPSWANIRDKVAMGLLDGAQMLAGMPIAATAGAGPVHVPMVSAFSMSLNGNAITVSTALYDKLLGFEPGLASDRCLAGAALKALILEDKRAGRPQLVFAHVYSFSSHHYQLRYWLSASGIDPDNDVRLVVAPPQQMERFIRIGNIDGYCVGEPWNSLSVEQGSGKVLISGYEIWNNAPEKVFGVTKKWADAHPLSHKALIKALLKASQWLGQIENRSAVAELLSGGDCLPLPANIIETALSGSLLRSGTGQMSEQESSVFHRHCATFPWVSHAQWFITQMYRWGQLTTAVDIGATAAQVYQPELYIEAATELGFLSPSTTAKLEGLHSAEWRLAKGDELALGPDRFVDGRVFDPDHCLAYLRESLMHHDNLTAGLLRSLSDLNA